MRPGAGRLLRARSHVPTHILIIPRPDTCHITGAHACASIYTHARLTVSTISPRCAHSKPESEMLRLFAPSSSQRSAHVGARVRTRSFARGHAPGFFSVVTFRLPYPMRHVPLYLLPTLSFSRQSLNSSNNATRCIRRTNELRLSIE